MPNLSGIEVTRQIKHMLPATAVLVLSAYDDDEYVFALLEAGAAGYLLKNVRGRNLVDAVRSVHAGESVLHPVIARKVIERAVRPFPPNWSQEGLELLSERELDVLRLAARGMSNRDIAHELCLSTRTVQTHLGTVFAKMQVASRTEAVVRALQRGWLTLEDTLSEED